MKDFEIPPKDPSAILDKLDEERQTILKKINNPLARIAVRAVAPLGFGPLADNSWQTSYTKRKTNR